MSSMAEIVDENRLFQQARQRGEETTRRIKAEIFRRRSTNGPPETAATTTLSSKPRAKDKITHDDLVYSLVERFWGKEESDFQGGDAKRLSLQRWRNKVASYEALLASAGPQLFLDYNDSSLRQFFDIFDDWFFGGALSHLQVITWAEKDGPILEGKRGMAAVEPTDLDRLPWIFVSKIPDVQNPDHEQSIRLLSTLLHEMIHAYIHMYICRCADGCEWVNSEPDPHPVAFMELASAVQREARRVFDSRWNLNHEGIWLQRMKDTGTWLLDEQSVYQDLEICH